MSGEFAYAVYRAGVEAAGAVWLRLQPDAHMFDRTGDNAVGYSGEGTGEVVLEIG